MGPTEIPPGEVGMGRLLSRVAALSGTAVGKLGTFQQIPLLMKDEEIQPRWPMASQIACIAVEI